MHQLIERIFVESGGRVERDNAGNILTYSEECDPYVFAMNIVQECVAFVGKQRNDIPACGFEFESALLDHFKFDKWSRENMIQALLDDDVERFHNDHEQADMYLHLRKYGHRGYGEWSDVELREELEAREA